MNKIPMTVEGFNHLNEEVKRLKSVDRPAIIRAIAEARTHGDLAENAEYHAARERQSFIEGRLAELEDKIARAEVIDTSKLSGSVVKFGATVTLADEETDEEQTFRIVGEDEADIRNGRLSVTSPLARALIGKGEGDSVEVSTPRGNKSYEVVGVAFSEAPAKRRRASPAKPAKRATHR
ncbi:MAG: transcription elongation factor GreA [Alphaproteobacteria bacterium]|jgi:transcription elongation factor GreA|nr:transcription elongation factor GreA [Alphaproteobacteria bacterium]MBV9014676.1 transcription elongation factor GreA [Alphaproteobacteria bacterium]MBV9152554.1 transcription elongation factor GreA [Alphaproteobacteria bacterium]MBV9587641.1 transcription elongation factor GreA [Alphaproteobacteria bacterium]MBV9966675.1 transcription elongation factor GreA [Alphaproteobacteria bacterium]